MKQVTIRPAYARDATYVTAHMRELDKKEIYCQLPEGTISLEVAAMLLSDDGSYKYIAYLDGQPVCLFGFTAMTPYALSAWAIGTNKMSRVAGAVAAFVFHELVPIFIKQGYLTMEARSMSGHWDAHSWMRGTGATCCEHLYPWGSAGETFKTFRWTIEGYRDIRRSSRRWSRDLDKQGYPYVFQK